MPVPAERAVWGNADFSARCSLGKWQAAQKTLERQDCAVAVASLSTRLPVHMPEQSGESGEGGPVRPELPSRTQTAVMKRGDAVLGVNSPKGN